MSHPPQTIKVGSRASKLALIQVEEILTLLKTKGQDIAFETQTRSTRGDLDQKTPLTPNPADDFFTDTLDEALLNREVDVAIHSAKDMPEKLREGLKIFALTASPDETDAFVGKTAFDQLPEGARVATSSLLRQAKVKALNPKLQTVDIRGTIEERIKKYHEGYCDGVIVATVALKRLGLADHIQNIMPWEAAALQGQLAVVGRSDDSALQELFSKIDVRKNYGRVLLVGAGPGDPGLITVKGIHALAAADCVLYDYLVPIQLLEYAPQAEKIYAGKRKGDQAMPQDELNKLLRQKALAGKTVVRLKGGDPLVFGRGGDEIGYLRSYHIGVEVVPGISSAVGIPSSLGIPLTARDVSSSVAFVSAHRQGEDAAHPAPLEIPKADTLIFLMGLTKLEQIVHSLESAGWDAQTPVMIISKGTWAEEKIIQGNIADIRAKAATATLEPPVLIVVGETLKFYQTPQEDQRPRILYTGTDPQYYRLPEKIVPWPMIEIVPARMEPSALKQLLTKLDRYDIILCTSRFGARTFFELLGKEHRLLGRLRAKPFVALGQATARELVEQRIRKMLVAEDETSQGVLAAMTANFDLGGAKILFPRSSLPNPYLKDKLTALGAKVDELTVYENVKPPKRPLPEGKIDGIIFTSPSTMRNFIEDYEKIPEGWRILSRGPLTSRCLREHGYTNFEELK